MTVALQAVAKYPDSSDFVRAVQQRLPGVAAYLQAAAQPSGCDQPATHTETMPMEAEPTAGTSGNATAGPSEEAGRKSMAQEVTASASTSSVTESPTSRPPPDKQRADAPQPTLKSLVIARLPFRVGHLGAAAPQISMGEAIDRYGTLKLAPMRALSTRAQTQTQL